MKCSFQASYRHGKDGKGGRRRSGGEAGQEKQNKQWGEEKKEGVKDIFRDLPLKAWKRLTRTTQKHFVSSHGLDKC